MAGGDKHLFDKVLVPLFHTGNTSAAPFLDPVSRTCLTLDIAKMGQRNNAVFLGNQVFNVHVPLNRTNLGAAVIAEFIPDFAQFFFENLHDLAVIAEQFCVLLDLFFQLAQFFLDFEDFQSGQLTDTISYDCACLWVIKPEFFHNRSLGFRDTALAGTNRRDDLVDNVNCPSEAFQNMRPVGRFF